MATPTEVNLVKTYYDKAQAKLAELNAAKDLLNKTTLDYEMAKRGDYITTVYTGNGRDSETPESVANNILVFVKNYQNQVDTIQIAYNKAENEYTTKSNELLTADQKNQLKAAQDAETNNKNAAAEAKKAEAAKLMVDAQAGTFAQSQSKIILFAGVGLVLVVVGVFIYFKFFKAKAVI